MQFNKLTRHKAFALLAKTLIGVTLFTVVLAPITSVMNTPVVAVAHAQTTPTPTPTPTPTQTGDGNKPLECSINSFSICISNIVYIFAISLTTALAYGGGYLFNFAIQLGLNSGSYALDFLSQGWAIVRDIANLSFIFILIYIAYTIIIQAETAGTMRMLAGVVVMALLINFSFFISRVVIDAGNILAVQFYNAIPITDVTKSPLGGVNQPMVKNLTSGIMDAVQVQQLLANDSFKIYTANNNLWTNIGTQITVYIAFGIFLSLLAFVFIIVGVRLLVRIVVLWIAIIASPLAFAAHAIPATNAGKKLHSAYNKWFSSLIESAFYPAVFLFLFYIMTLLLTGIAGANGLIGNVFADANSAGGGTIGLMSVIANIGVRVGLITVLLYFAMKASDSFSTIGSNTARSMVSWAGGAALGVTAGGAAWAARNTAGRGANALAQNQTVKKWAGSSVVGDRFQRGLQGIARSPLDARGVPGMGAGIGVLNRTVGTNIRPGATQKGGFAQQQANRTQQVVARAKELKGTPADIAKAQRAFEASKVRALDEYKKNYPGGEAAYNKRKEELLKEKERYERRVMAAETSAEKDEARKQLAQINKELSPFTDKNAAVTAITSSLAERLDKYKKQGVDLGSTEQERAAARARAAETVKELENYKDGKTKVSDVQNDTLKAFAARIGEPNFRNINMPSRGSIEGAEQVRKMIPGGGASTEAPAQPAPAVTTPAPVRSGNSASESRPTTPAREQKERPVEIHAASLSKEDAHKFASQVATNLHAQNGAQPVATTPGDSANVTRSELEKTLRSLRETINKTAEISQDETSASRRKEGGARTGESVNETLWKPKDAPTLGPTSSVPSVHIPDSITAHIDPKDMDRIAASKNIVIQNGGRGTNPILNESGSYETTTPNEQTSRPHTQEPPPRPIPAQHAPTQPHKDGDTGENPGTQKAA